MMDGIYTRAACRAVDGAPVDGAPAAAPSFATSSVLGDVLDRGIDGVKDRNDLIDPGDLQQIRDPLAWRGQRQRRADRGCLPVQGDERAEPGRVTERQLGQVENDWPGDGGDLIDDNVLEGRDRSQIELAGDGQHARPGVVAGGLVHVQVGSRVGHSYVIAHRGGTMEGAMVTISHRENATNNDNRRANADVTDVH